MFLCSYVRIFLSFSDSFDSVLQTRRDGFRAVMQVTPLINNHRAEGDDPVLYTITI
jgi:hypothetical protein